MAHKIAFTHRPFPWLKMTRSAMAVFPECWDEITPRQLIALSRASSNNISNVEFLTVFTGAQKSIIKKLDAYQQLKLIEAAGFVNDISPYSRFIIPKLIVKNKVFTAPEPMLENMTFGQFIFADSFFRNYNDTQQKSEMFSFLASLYIPEKKRFKEKFIQDNAPLMEQVNYDTRQAVRLNYILIFEWLMNSYPLVFPRPQEKSDSKKKQVRDPRSWIKVFESLVGDDIVNQDRYSKLPVHSVFRYFTRTIKERIKSKKR